MRHLAEAYTDWPDLRAIERDYSPGSGSASMTTGRPAFNGLGIARKLDAG